MAGKKSNTPRRLRMKRAGRLHSAEAWLPAYPGKNIVRGYARWYGVDFMCAIKELQMLGEKIAPVYIERVKRTEAEKGRRTLARKKALAETPWTVIGEQGSEYLEDYLVAADFGPSHAICDLEDEIPF